MDIEHILFSLGAMELTYTQHYKRYNSAYLPYFHRKFYCKIYSAVRRHRKEIHVLHLQQKAQDRKVVPNAERIRKSAVGTFYVYILFLVCYLPYICINYIYIISGTNSLLKATENYSLTLLFLNSSLNPLVYCWKMKEIRHAIMELLRSVMLLRKQADPR